MTGGGVGRGWAGGWRAKGLESLFGKEGLGFVRCEAGSGGLTARCRCGDTSPTGLGFGPTPCSVAPSDRKYYTGTIKKPEKRRPSCVEVYFPKERPSKYWFPADDIRRWLKEHGPADGRPDDLATQGEHLGGVGESHRGPRDPCRRLGAVALPTAGEVPACVQGGELPLAAVSGGLWAWPGGKGGAAGRELPLAPSTQRLPRVWAIVPPPIPPSLPLQRVARRAPRCRRPAAMTLRAF